MAVMRTGLIVSVIGHLILIAWGIFSLASTATLDTDIEAVPVEFVTLDEETDLAPGMTTAAIAPKPSPNDPAEAVAEEPPPEPPAPEAKPEPPPPPPPPPESEPPLPEEAAVEQPPEPEPAAPPETEPLPDPEAEAEAEPPAEEPPLAPPEQTAVRDPVPTPKERPSRPAPPTPEKKDEFDPDRIAALLDKEAETAPAAQSDAPASIGVATGNPDAKMTLNELVALRTQVQRCWTIPTGWTHPREVSVTIRFGLNPDGTVKGTPVVIEFPASQYGQVSADNAIRAVLSCGPYKLPAEKYDQWSEVQIRFTPEV
jgi:hypothetical protein